MDNTWQHVLELCNKFSEVTYENLTKIIRYADSGSADGARNLDDSFQNDVDHWMGGGTCFSMTWFVYKELQELGLKPRLWMGHKRKERNIHCALYLPYEGKEYLFDPGYLIFDPLELPLLPTAFATEPTEAFYPLVPNVVRLRRTPQTVELWTGSLKGPLKLRFEFEAAGVEENEFRAHWSESFSREMMTYPVLNKLDREKGIQYYFQKGNLMTRTAEGSTMEKIERNKQGEVLSKIFNLAPDLIEKALSVLDGK